MLQWLCPYVASFYSKCFICFFGVCCKCVCLDVAYVFEICFISVLSRCCLCFCNGFNCFSCVFASFSDACFKYFIWLQTYVLHLNVLFQMHVFASFSDACFKFFRCMFQVFSCVAFKCFKSKSDVASPSSSSVASPRCLLLSAPAGHPPPSPALIDAGEVWGSAGLMWARETM